MAKQCTIQFYCPIIHISYQWNIYVIVLRNIHVIAQIDDFLFNFVIYIYQLLYHSSLLGRFCCCLFSAVKNHTAMNINLKIFLWRKSDGGTPSWQCTQSHDQGPGFKFLCLKNSEKLYCRCIFLFFYISCSRLNFSLLYLIKNNF